MARTKMKTKGFDLDNGSSFGIVAILDVLGVSSYSLESTKSFLRSRNVLIEQLQPLSEKFSEFEEDLCPPEISTFENTLIFTWVVGKDRVMKGLVPVAEWLSTAVNLGIYHKMLLRGAISVGEYVIEKNTVIGQAVAAAWYEDADWFGVTLTSSIEFHLISLIESEYGKDTGGFEKWFVEYDVPRKGSMKKKQRCVVAI
ncbi:MAG TPA: hypothetical protein VI727_11965 [Candidatus Brocadiaceae bacterium]|nr:hypothetical protein [Candidatus Brocadiaceae bacterium]